MRTKETCSSLCIPVLGIMSLTWFTSGLAAPTNQSLPVQHTIDFPITGGNKQTATRLSSANEKVQQSQSTSTGAMKKLFYLVSGVSTQGNLLVLTDQSGQAPWNPLQPVWNSTLPPFASGSPVTVEPIQSGNMGQLWWAEAPPKPPNGIPGRYLHSALGNTVGNILGGLDSGNSAWGTSAAKANSAQGSNTSGNPLLLSFTGSCADSGTAVVLPSQATSPFGINTTVADDGAEWFQQWSAVPMASISVGNTAVTPFRIKNSSCNVTGNAGNGTGGAGASTEYWLTVQGATAGSPVKLSSASYSTAQQWYPWPNYPLEAVLNTIPVPFPIGTGNNQAAYKAAYNAINEQLNPTPPLACKRTISVAQPGNYENLQNYTVNTSKNEVTISLEGLRCTYSDYGNGAILNSYQTQLGELAYSDNNSYDQNAWSTVKNQLTFELQDAVAIQSMYSNFDLITLTNNITFIALENELITAVLGSAEATNNVSGVAKAVAEGALYTVFSALGPVSSVAANLGSTLVDAASAYKQGQTDSLDYKFTVAANQLWSTLATNFQTLTAATQNQAQVILTNWGMMQAVDQLISSSGPDSLSFELSENMVTKIERQSAAGFVVQSMHILMPSVYQITRLTAQANGDTFPDVPSYAQLADNLGNAGTSNIYNNYYISGHGYPSQTVMNYALYGVLNPSNQVLLTNPHDLFTASNDWGVLSMNDEYLDCYGQLLTLTNFTNMPMTVTTNPIKGFLGGNGVSLIAGSVGTTSQISQNLPAYGSVTVAGGLGTGGMEFSVSIDTANGLTVGGFGTNQHRTCISNQPWFGTPLQSFNGFDFTTPVITGQSFEQPSTIWVGIWSNKCAANQSVANYLCTDSPNPFDPTQPFIKPSFTNIQTEVGKPTVIGWQLNLIPKGTRVRINFAADGSTFKVIRSVKANQSGIDAIKWRPSRKQITDSGLMQICARPNKTSEKVCSPLREVKVTHRHKG